MASADRPLARMGGHQAGFVTRVLLIAVFRMPMNTNAYTTFDNEVSKRVECHLNPKQRRTFWVHLKLIHLISASIISRYFLTVTRARGTLTAVKN